MDTPSRPRPSRLAALVLEALDNLVAVDRRETIVADALGRSGRAELPDDPVELIAFAHGPLRDAAAKMLDAETVWALVGEISVAATVALRGSEVPVHDKPTDPPDDAPPAPAGSSPSMPRRSSDPSAKRHHTVGYQAAMLRKEGGDPLVLVVSADEPGRCAVCQRFSSVGYDVRKAGADDRVSWLAAKLEPRLIVMQAPSQAGGEAFVAEMRSELGADMPPLLVIVPGQEQVVAMDDAYLLDGIDEVLALANQIVRRARGDSRTR